jgi:pimeloyl-ACP methyl ester carboxylesterase
VLRIDLRAHGTSEGVAVTFDDREPEDVLAALRFLRSQPGVGPLHLFGVSMGGGASLTAFARGEPHVESMVALAPASDFRPLVDRRLPPFEPVRSLARAIVRGVTHGLGNRSPLELAPADAIVAAGPSRILVVHSRSDEVIPASVSESLSARAPWVEIAWIDGVDHVSMPAHTLETIPLRERIERMLDVRE